MNTDTTDTSGLRVLFQRACAFEESYTDLGQFPLVKGWQTKIVNLNSATLNSSFNTSAWSTGNILSFGVLPTLQNANIQVDWMKLEDSSSCGTTNTTYSFATVGNDDLFTIWIDDDTDPFNGFF